MKLPAALFAEASAADALAWGREPLRFEAAAALGELGSLEALWGWLACNTLTTPYFSVLHDGMLLAEEEVCSRRLIAGRPVGGHMDGGRVRAWLARGATLMLNKVEDWHPGIQAVCQSLSRQLRAEVGALLFYTAAGHHGARVHRDPCHVVVIQLAGRKRWHLYDLPDAAQGWEPGFPSRARLGPPAGFELGPGGALYIPLGQAHEAWTESEPSLHLSLSIVEPRQLDAVSLALQACVQGIPRHAVLSGDTAGRLRGLEELIGKLRHALSDLDAATLLARLERRFDDSAREEPCEPSA